MIYNAVFDYNSNMAQCTAFILYEELNLRFDF